MLTKQGNTQVYSPFGSYAVEQHGGGCERPQRCVPEPHATEQPQSNSDFEGVAESGVGEAYWSLVTSARAVPSTSAITRSVLASNSMPTRRMPVTEVSAFTPSACF